jgi:hypothetical protein
MNKLFSKLFDFTQIGATLAVAGGLLAGCAAGTITTDIAALTSAVQAITVPLCGFLPAETSIATIFSGAGAVLSTAEAIASTICNAVTSPSPASVSMRRRLGARGLPVVTLPNGQQVVVQGQFVTH